jgi:hypothetical protein
MRGGGRHFRNGSEKVYYCRQVLCFRWWQFTSKIYAVQYSVNTYLQYSRLAPVNDIELGL